MKELPPSAQPTIPVATRLGFDDDGDTDHSNLRLAVPRWMTKGEGTQLQLEAATDGSTMTLVFHGAAFQSFATELRGECRIGRALENDLCWSWCPSLSRRHCRLVRSNRQVWIEDLGSRNGTWVDGVPVRQCQLYGGERIGLGDLELQVFFVACP